MEYGKIDGIDKPVSRLIQGTVMLSTERQAAGNELMDAVFALGVNAFDTAHVYGGGDTERAFGRWVNDRGLREKVVLLDKGAHHNADRQRVTPWDIGADILGSLARLQFEYIDLYLLHRDDPGRPVGPIVEALNEHKSAGRIRAFGVSNWTVERIEEANEYAEKHALTGLAASSPQFSLAEQVAEPWANCVTITGDRQPRRQWYIDTQMPLMPWSSLGWGFFFGDYKPQDLADEQKRASVPALRCYGSEANFRRRERAERLAAEKGASIAQIVLAWVLRQPMNVFPLVGPVTVEQAEDCAGAVEVNLSPEERAWLNLERDER